MYTYDYIEFLNKNLCIIEFIYGFKQSICFQLILQMKKKKINEVPKVTFNCDLINQIKSNFYFIGINQTIYLSPSHKS